MCECAGNGAHDSDLDLLLFGQKGDVTVAEHLSKIVCKLSNPLIFSHHDLIASICSIPALEQKLVDRSTNIVAPRVPNTRFATKWSPDGVAEYQQRAPPLLSQIRETWGHGKDSSSISLLFSTTYAVLNLATKATNSVIKLDKKPKVKSKPNPTIDAAAKSILAQFQHIKTLELSPLSTVEAAKVKLATS